MWTKITIENLIDDFLCCCRYDPLMEGPKFITYNRSELDRFRKRIEIL